MLGQFRFEDARLMNEPVPDETLEKVWFELTPVKPVTVPVTTRLLKVTLENDMLAEPTWPLGKTTGFLVKVMVGHKMPLLNA